MNTYAKFGALSAVIIGVLAWLAVGGVSESKSYYKEIKEVHQMGDQAQGKRLRVNGYVEEGSIVRDGAQVTFIMHQNPGQLHGDADPGPRPACGQLQWLRIERCERSGDGVGLGLHQQRHD